MQIFEEFSLYLIFFYILHDKTKHEKIIFFFIFLLSLVLFRFQKSLTISKVESKIKGGRSEVEDFEFNVSKLNIYRIYEAKRDENNDQTKENVNISLLRCQLNMEKKETKALRILF